MKPEILRAAELLGRSKLRQELLDFLEVEFIAKRNDANRLADWIEKTQNADDRELDELRKRVER